MINFVVAIALQVVIEFILPFNRLSTTQRVTTKSSLKRAIFLHVLVMHHKLILLLSTCHQNIDNFGYISARFVTGIAI